MVEFNILPAQVFCYFLRHTACASVNALNLLSPTSRGGSCEVGTGTMKVLPWVVDGAGGLGAGKTSGAGTRGVSLNAAIGARTGYSDTNGGESSNN